MKLKCDNCPFGLGTAVCNQPFFPFVWKECIEKE